jgi:hypothetical protein
MARSAKPDATRVRRSGGFIFFFMLVRLTGDGSPYQRLTRGKVGRGVSAEPGAWEGK